MSEIVDKGYTLREIFALAVDTFDIKISGYEYEYKEKYEGLLNTYKKRMTRCLDNHDYRPIGKKKAKPNNNLGNAYSEEAVDFILFDENGLYNLFLDEPRSSDAIPIKPNSYYDTLQKEAVQNIIETLESLDMKMMHEEDKEPTLEDMHYNEEEFRMKKIEIMAEAVFKKHFVLDEEKLKHDIMFSSMYKPQDDASVIRSLENLKDNRNYYKRKSKD